jgi:LIVCS family branched-chain amino acid:cation transporter
MVGISALVSSVGLNNIVTFIGPLLDACYPAAIVVVLYYVICPKLGSLRLLNGARFAMIAAAVVGFIDVLNSYNSLLNINNAQFTNFYHWLPLSAYHLTWIPVSAVCFLLGALLCRPKTK